MSNQLVLNDQLTFHQIFILLLGLQAL